MIIRLNLNQGVVIIEADGKIDDLNGYGTPIFRRLREMGIGAKIIPLENNADILKQLPPRPLIFSGGMTEVTADVDWIIQAKEIIQDIIKQNQRGDGPKYPMFGICFGAQLIAEAYSPGSVSFLEDPEIGVSRIELSHQHELFKGFKNSFDAYSFHYNQIWSEDLHPISISYHKGHRFLQSFEIPDAMTYGVQFHPEFKYEEIIMLFRFYKKLIAELGFNIQPVIESLPELSNNWTILENFLRYTT